MGVSFCGKRVLSWFATTLGPTLFARPEGLPGLWGAPGPDWSFREGSTVTTPERPKMWSSPPRSSPPSRGAAGWGWSLQAAVISADAMSAGQLFMHASRAGELGDTRGHAVTACR